MNRSLLFIFGVAVGATGSALLLNPKTRPMLMETAAPFRRKRNRPGSS